MMIGLPYSSRCVWSLRQDEPRRKSDEGFSRRCVRQERGVCRGKMSGGPGAVVTVNFNNEVMGEKRGVGV